MSKFFISETLVTSILNQRPRAQAPQLIMSAWSGWSAQLGDRIAVTVRGARCLGTLRFLGPTKFKGGEWAGVELDTDKGTHGGTLRGVSYFSCRYGRGVFVRASTLQPADARRAAQPLVAALRAAQRLPAASPEAENIEPGHSPPWKRRGERSSSGGLTRGSGRRGPATPLSADRCDVSVTPDGSPPPSSRAVHVSRHGSVSIGAARSDAAAVEEAIALGLSYDALGSGNAQGGALGAPRPGVAKRDTPMLARTAPVVAGANAFGELSIDLFRSDSGNRDGVGVRSARAAAAALAATSAGLGADVGVRSTVRGMGTGASAGGGEEQADGAASHRRVHRLLLHRLEDAQAQARAHATQVSVLLRTVTFYANLAHSLTRSP